MLISKFSFQDHRYDCFGINDRQVNAYLKKIGFKDIGSGYAAILGDTIVLKSGYIRMFLSPKLDHYAIPSSMTATDWDLLKKYRQNGYELLLFVSREFGNSEWVQTLKKNCEIPSEQQILENSISGEDFEGHSALLSILGTSAVLHDCNNFEDRSEEATYVDQFYSTFREFALPKIVYHLGLKMVDLRSYTVAPCLYSYG